MSFNYDYKKAIKADIRDYIREEINFSDFSDLEDLEDHLNDHLWNVDCVTGNASGSYTFDSRKARDYVLDNPDLVIDMCQEFCLTAENIAEHFLNGGWEYFDVSIRCFLLPGLIHQVMEEIAEEFEEAKEA